MEDVIMKSRCYYIWLCLISGCWLRKWLRYILHILVVIRITFKKIRFLNKWVSNTKYPLWWGGESTMRVVVPSWASTIIKSNIKNNLFKILFVFLSPWRSIHLPAKSHTNKVIFFNMERRMALGYLGAGVIGQRNDAVPITTDDAQLLWPSLQNLMDGIIGAIQCHTHTLEFP